MLRRTTMAGAAVALALTLAACNGDGDPTGESTWIPTATRTPTPTEAETFDPTKETAREFLDRWRVITDEAQRTLDGSAYRAIYTPLCNNCKSFMRNLNQVRKNGGWIRTDGSRIASAKHDVATQWTVEVESQPTTWKASADADVQTLEGGTDRMVVYIERDENGAWKITQYEVIATGVGA